MRNTCAPSIPRVSASVQLSESISRAIDVALAPIGLSMAELGRLNVADPDGFTLSDIIASMADDAVADEQVAQEVEDWQQDRLNEHLGGDTESIRDDGHYPYNPDRDHDEVPF